jgi:hypothetical protein
VIKIRCICDNSSIQDCIDPELSYLIFEPQSGYKKTLAILPSFPIGKSTYLANNYKK